jgi:hypothetical protein
MGSRRSRGGRFADVVPGPQRVAPGSETDEPAECTRTGQGRDVGVDLAACQEIGIGQEDERREGGALAIRALPDPAMDQDRIAARSEVEGDEPGRGIVPMQEWVGPQQLARTAN